MAKERVRDAFVLEKSTLFLFLKQKYGIHPIIGTCPIPQSYYKNHTALKTWD
jgi:hypothetical protein